MNVIFQIIPFLIVFIIIYTVIKPTNKIVFFKTGRTSKLIIVSYIVFLTVSVLVAYLLPNPNVTNEPDIDVEQVEDIEQSFYDLANSGQLAQTVGIYETDKWSFAYHQEQLTVIEGGGNYIFYEKKAENDDKIDVIRYTTKFIFNELDYTDIVVSPRVDLAENQLTISEPPHVDIRLASFNKEFTITQFTGESTFNNHNRIWGIDALVIRVPANVEISTNHFDSVEFINVKN